MTPHQKQTRPPKPIVSEEPTAVIKSSENFIEEKLLGSYTVHNNLGEKVSLITESKLKVCLMEYLQNLEKRGVWIAPLGILATIVITLLTADFQDKFYISRYTWQAIFILSAIISSVWLILVFIKRPKEVTIDDIVREMIPPLEETKSTTRKTK